MTIATLDRPTKRPTDWSRAFDPLADQQGTGPVTLLQLIDQALDRNTADAAALASLVLESYPNDYGSLRRGLQELVLAEIVRRLAGGASAAAAAPLPAPAPDRFERFERRAPHRRGGRRETEPGEPRDTEAASTKWAETIAVANDPLQAQVLLRGVFVPWANLTADDLRLMAQDDERQATKLLERVLRLDALARDMEAAGALRLADLPGAAARIGGL